MSILQDIKIATLTKYLHGPVASLVSGSIPVSKIKWHTGLNTFIIGYDHGYFGFCLGSEFPSIEGSAVILPGATTNTTCGGIIQDFNSGGFVYFATTVGWAVNSGGSVATIFGAAFPGNQRAYFTHPLNGKHYALTTNLFETSNNWASTTDYGAFTPAINVQSYAQSQNGQFFVAAGQTIAVFVDLNTDITDYSNWKIASLNQAAIPTTAISVTENGDRVVIGSQKGHVSIWDNPSSGSSPVVISGVNNFYAISATLFTGIITAITYDPVNAGFIITVDNVSVGFVPDNQTVVNGIIRYTNSNITSASSRTGPNGDYNPNTGDLIISSSILPNVLTRLL